MAERIAGYNTNELSSQEKLREVTTSKVGTKTHLDSGDIDDASGGKVTIEFEHHEIHEGDSYTIQTFNDIDDAANFDLGVTTPNTTKWGHFVMETEIEAEMELYLYEGATISSGSAVTPINRNRNSSNTSGMTVVSGPTVGATGSLLVKQKAGSGKKIGGTTRDANEFIFKQNTKYLFRITNVSGSDAQFASIRITWYEHTSKE